MVEVSVHHAQVDAGRIEPHLSALRALGISLHTLALDADSERPASSGFDLYYLSSSAMLAPCEQRLRTRLQQGTPRASLLVFLDAVELAADWDERLRPFKSLAGYSAASGQLMRKLTRTVLETIDEISGATISEYTPEDATLMLPSALVISCDGNDFLVPQDFMGLVTLGRGANCQIRLDSSFVSRLHGCFRSSSEGFHYRDLSSNGTTLLQGHEEALLHDDEVVLPAQCALRVGDRIVSLQINA